MTSALIIEENLFSVNGIKCNISKTQLINFNSKYVRNQISLFYSKTVSTDSSSHWECDKL